MQNLTSFSPIASFSAAPCERLGRRPSISARFRWPHPKRFWLPPMYPVTLTPDGDTVLVMFAEVPEALTFGARENPALLQAVDGATPGLAHAASWPAVRPAPRLAA